MPYIQERGWIDERLRSILSAIEQDANVTPGEINYIVTRIVKTWLTKRASYCDFNRAIGVLECVKLELYRRMVAPYEDKKREENGDVY